MTNGDRIRDMSYKELAKLLRSFSHCPCPAESYCRKEQSDCERNIQGWLNQKVEEDAD